MEIVHQFHASPKTDIRAGGEHTWIGLSVRKTTEHVQVSCLTQDRHWSRSGAQNGLRKTSEYVQVLLPHILF